MKKLLLILLCLPMIGFGQSVPTSEEAPELENMPEFPCIDFSYTHSEGYYTVEYCGEQALLEFVKRAIKYPPEALNHNITGKVYVSFIVDKSGSVTNAKIETGADKNLDAEALRVVNSLPKYKPGYDIEGKPVRVKFTLPINFTLD